MNPSTPDSRLKRRQSLFRRILSWWTLLSVALVCVGIWAAIHIWRCRVEQTALSQLRQVEDGRSFDVSLSNPFLISDGAGTPNVLFSGGPKWLVNLLGVDPFATATGLQVIAPGNSFSYGSDENGRLLIDPQFRSGVTNEEMELIARLRNLEQLSLEANPVGDTGVEWLSRLSRLEKLNLANTRISNTSLPVLAKLPRLKVLNLSHTHVSDAGLMQFATSTTLEQLDVSMTRVTAEGVHELQQQLPGCTIIH